MTEDTKVTKLALIKYAMGLPTEVLATQIRAIHYITRGSNEVDSLNFLMLKDSFLQICYDYPYNEPDASKTLTILYRDKDKPIVFGYFTTNQILRPLNNLLKRRIKTSIKARIKDKPKGEYAN